MLKGVDYLYRVEFYYAIRKEDMTEHDIVIPKESPCDNQKDSISVRNKRDEVEEEEEQEQLRERDLRVIPKDVIFLKKDGVGYRNPFENPSNAFVFNQKNYHGYIRVVNQNEHVVWNALIYNKELQKLANMHMKGNPVVWLTGDGIMVYECDIFNNAIICQKVLLDKTI